MTQTRKMVSRGPERRRDLDDVLDRIAEYLEERQDTRDRDDGSVGPNTEMSLLGDLRRARGKA